MHTFECPSYLGGGCCPVGLRCALEACLEYEYKTLAAFQPIPTTNANLAFATESTIPATMVPAFELHQTWNLSFSNLTSRTSWPTFEPSRTREQAADIPISERILGTPTATNRKIGLVAVSSDAEEGREGKAGRKRLRRLGCVLLGELIITVVMMVF